MNISSMSLTVCNLHVGKIQYKVVEDILSNFIWMKLNAS